jgi:hypothetical protein
MRLDLNEKYTALKIHFGEPGNMSYIRPPYVAVVSRLVRELGASRSLRTRTPSIPAAAQRVRPSPRRFRERILPRRDRLRPHHRGRSQGQRLRQYARDGRRALRLRPDRLAVAEADAVISLNHFKGHELTGFGGALKNLGMGAASRSGKKFLHEYRTR